MPGAMKSAAVAVAFAAVGYAFAPTLIELVGATPGTLAFEYTVDYVRTTFLGVEFAAATLLAGAAAAQQVLMAPQVEATFETLQVGVAEQTVTVDYELADTDWQWAQHLGMNTWLAVYTQGGQDGWQLDQAMPISEASAQVSFSDQVSVRAGQTLGICLVAAAGAGPLEQGMGYVCQEPVAVEIGSLPFEQQLSDATVELQFDRNIDDQPWFASQYGFARPQGFVEMADQQPQPEQAAPAEADQFVTQQQAPTEPLSERDRRAMQGFPIGGAVDQPASRRMGAPDYGVRERHDPWAEDDPFAFDDDQPYIRYDPYVRSYARSFDTSVWSVPVFVNPLNQPFPFGHPGLFAHPGFVKRGFSRFADPIQQEFRDFQPDTMFRTINEPFIRQFGFDRFSRPDARDIFLRGNLDRLFDDRFHGDPTNIPFRHPGFKHPFRHPGFKHGGFKHHHGTPQGGSPGNATPQGSGANQ